MLVSAGPRTSGGHRPTVSYQPTSADIINAKLYPIQIIPFTNEKIK